MLRTLVLSFHLSIYHLLSSVTRWLEHWFHIGELTTRKNSQKAFKFCQIVKTKCRNFAKFGHTDVELLGAELSSAPTGAVSADKSGDKLSADRWKSTSACVAPEMKKTSLDKSFVTLSQTIPYPMEKWFSKKVSFYLYLHRCSVRPFIHLPFLYIILPDLYFYFVNLSAPYIIFILSISLLCLSFYSLFFTTICVLCFILFYLSAMSIFLLSIFYYHMCPRSICSVYLFVLSIFLLCLSSCSVYLSTLSIFLLCQSFSSINLIFTCFRSFAWHRSLFISPIDNLSSLRSLSSLTSFYSLIFSFL